MSKKSALQENLSYEQKFLEYLKSKGLRFTTERQVILNWVFKSHKHFEAEDLLMDIRQSGERVSKATIYRTLNLLVNCGLLREVIFGEKHSHYEHVHGDEHHDHLVCNGCGKIIEFTEEEIERLQDAVCLRYRFLPASHRLQIQGLCHGCQRAVKE
ncbi:MAG TPA: Fur family transcriptional regulator [Candidatus Hypogeohydataceae bacterium YC41]